MNESQQQIADVCDSIKTLLLDKNKKYGDSALNPLRIMSKSSNIEQILVRIDDKLNRLKQGSNNIVEDEDVLTDLIGYFVLLKVALNRKDVEKMERGVNQFLTIPVDKSQDTHYNNNGLDINPLNY